MKRLILWVLIAAGLTCETMADAPPPNIVFILADDLGWRDLASYGSRFYETPNLDRLAARGVSLTNAYAANPYCSPTRVSILTGLYPARSVCSPPPAMPLRLISRSSSMLPAPPIIGSSHPSQ